MAKVLYIRGHGSGPDRLADLLDPREFNVEFVSDLTNLATILPALRPDIVLLPCARPDARTASLCAGLREVSDVPVVFCSPAADEGDIVRAFAAGADDYLITPVRPVELSARLRAVLRRVSEQSDRRKVEDVVVAGDVEVRITEHRAFRRGKLLDLSPIEFRLLATLVREAGRAVSHSKLIARVWGPEYVDCRHYLRLYIKYLRAKLEDNSRDPKLVLSEWGVGYRFEPCREAARDEGGSRRATRAG